MLVATFAKRRPHLQHPMEVWLQPRAKDDGGDYKNEFFHAVLTLQGTNWIPGKE